MSIDAVFKETNIALKTLWEAVLLDKDGNGLAWTKPLITSVTTPRLKLVVNPTGAGTLKSYIDFELPDNISVTMYETVDRRVEKYLDSWMFGVDGVFNKATGQFRSRARDKVTNIYRGLRFVTTGWKNDTSGIDTGLKLTEHNQPIEEIIINQVENVIGRSLTIKETENLSAYLSENTSVKNQLKIMKTQQLVPILGAIAAQAANQVLGIVPGMFISRVVIPPPLLKLHAVNPIFNPPKVSTRVTNVNEIAKKQETPISLRKQASTPKTDSKQDFADGAKIKTYEHEDKNISTTTYTCAIEGYEPASYDYENGGPVTYTVNLSVLDYKTVYS